MLQTILNRFRENGMSDLEFVVVNSKVSHSARRIHELRRRVTFDVLQETDDEEVWSVLGGKKDDMFVYDRCGRLAYYVPFPLSNLFEYTYVIRAVVMAYYRNPCGGSSCQGNDTLSLSDILAKDEANATNADEDHTTLADSPEYFTSSYTSIDGSMNNLTDTIESADDTDSFNFSDSSEYSNNTFPFVNSSYISNTNVSEDLVHNNSTIEVTDTHAKIPQNEAMRNGIDHIFSHSNGESNHTTRSHKRHHPTSRRGHKSERCAEADYAVCQSWSKKRLLRAQTCCSVDFNLQLTAAQRHSACRNFGKKRCKKMHLVIKCCINSHQGINSLLETSTAINLPETSTVNGLQEISTVNNPSGKSIVNGLPEAIAAEEVEQTTVFPDVTCCKNVNAGRLCRVSSSGSCDEDEFVPDGPLVSKN